MRYENTVTGIFKERPNRFIAVVDIDGKEERCHVKNTGRCKEILIEGAKVVLAGPFENRKTRFDLVAVYKGDMLINIDSQAPNKAVHEFFSSASLFDDIETIRPEFTYGDSRFDFLIITGNKKILMEVKGVTLESDGMTLFPDAPTERGLKHVRELVSSMADGYETYVMFVVQMSGIHGFTTNDEMHPAFGEAVREARENGVKVLAYDCIVTENEMAIDKQVPVFL